MSERIVVCYTDPFENSSERFRREQAATAIRHLRAERFTPVSPEPQWRPYEPCKEGR